MFKVLNTLHPIVAVVLTMVNMRCLGILTILVILRSLIATSREYEDWSRRWKYRWSLGLSLPASLSVGIIGGDWGVASDDVMTT